MYPVNNPHHSGNRSDLTTTHVEFHHPTLPDLHVSIMKYVQDYGVTYQDEISPSVREIAAAVGFSVGIVHAAIQELLAGRYLRKTRVYQRNLRIVKMPYDRTGEAQ